MIKNKFSILIVEDTTDLWLSLNRAMKTLKLPFEAKCATSYSEAIEILHHQKPDLILCDYFLPNFRNGLEVWKYCKGQCPSVPFLMISGMSADQYLRYVSGLHHYPAFLSKPFTLSELSAALNELIDSKDPIHKAA